MRCRVGDWPDSVRVCFFRVCDWMRSSNEALCAYSMCKMFVRVVTVMDLWVTVRGRCDSLKFCAEAHQIMTLHPLTVINCS